VKLVAESFGWPFRGRLSTWFSGVVAVLLLPVMFIPLLGYAVAATRAAVTDPADGPPPWRLNARLLSDGWWVSLAVVLTALPFALVLNPLAGLLTGPAHGGLNAHVLAFFVLALPWGLFVLLFMPHATAAFAISSAPADLFDVASAFRDVRKDFAMWNGAAAAMVTAWAIGLACAGLLCIGIVPGIFYAILVSAHAAAALRRQDSRLPAG
jgi:hypothetical protein